MQGLNLKHGISVKGKKVFSLLLLVVIAASVLLYRQVAFLNMNPQEKALTRHVTLQENRTVETLSIKNEYLNVQKNNSIGTRNKMNKIYRTVTKVSVKEKSSNLQKNHSNVTRGATRKTVFRKNVDCSVRLKGNYDTRAEQEKTNNKSNFLVNTEACKIPDVDPFDKSIKHFIRKGASVNCDPYPSLTYQDGGWLRLNNYVLNTAYKVFSHCFLQEINRGDNSDDNRFYFSKLKTRFTKDILVSEEFIRVKCFNKIGQEVYKNYYAFTPLKPRRLKTLTRELEKHIKEYNPKEILNVVMLGIDSVSRLNHMRLMPKTRDLLRQLSAIELQGYTKVGDNTFVNIVPLTTGKFVEELPWDASMKSKPFDKYNFIWNTLSSRGYMTSFTEDVPHIAAFNYLKNGFHRPPTDYYARPLNLAITSDPSVKYKSQNCVKDRREINILFNYTKDFIQTYSHHPHFAFNFLSRLSHDDLNGASATDIPYSELIDNLHRQGLLNNSVLFFFSDHGIRFGSFRKTYIGRLEERLPIMYLVFPKWFYKKYPKIAHNLKMNRNRLTSPFDIYETLKNILYFTGSVKGHVEKNQRGISLFEEIPESRTCQQAGVLPHWCVCMDRQELSPVDMLYNTSAKYVVTEINKILTPSFADGCAELSLDKIKYVHLLQNNNQFYDNNRKSEPINNNVKQRIILQLALSVTPGEGEFEATVTHNLFTKGFNMEGDLDISRITKYGHDGDCIQNAGLRRYCYCIEGDETEAET